MGRGMEHGAWVPVLQYVAFLVLGITASRGEGGKEIYLRLLPVVLIPIRAQLYSRVLANPRVNISLYAGYH